MLRYCLTFLSCLLVSMAIGQGLPFNYLLVNEFETTSPDKVGEMAQVYKKAAGVEGVNIPDWVFFSTTTGKAYVVLFLKDEAEVQRQVFGDQEEDMKMMNALMAQEGFGETMASFDMAAHATSRSLMKFRPDLSHLPADMDPSELQATFRRFVTMEYTSEDPMKNMEGMQTIAAIHAMDKELGNRQIALAFEQLFGPGDTDLMMVFVSPDAATYYSDNDKRMEKRMATEGFPELFGNLWSNFSISNDYHGTIHPEYSKSALYKN